jgi:hypothetical protein
LGDSKGKGWSSYQGKGRVDKGGRRKTGSDGSFEVKVDRQGRGKYLYLKGIRL